ncbi:hypothetical protein O181_013480 [Austropuccinia psidii MF-1]|uniref:Phospholipid/glycerol acyltransferase domain-containing protein n=1 Tax=Austropuccinia psidii MF-1 TaxID=1389203 RepID=A0A9Q3BZ34_9BASI|nr:hypothetical protein [Austropuccinia psidii MF-1]
MPFGPTHELIKTIANWGVNSYYSTIVICHPNHVPKSGPVIFATNHWNMTVDPTIVSTKMPHGRQVHYWAKSSLFNNPIVRYVLLDAGNIPVYRNSKNHQLLFQGTFDVLKLGECIALFPEGTSYTEPKIMQIKDGLAWTALGFAKNLRLTGSKLSGQPETAAGLSKAPGPVKDVQVVVCGLSYTHKTRYRSSVQVEFSSPLTLEQPIIDQFMTEGQEKIAIRTFMQQIETRLKQVTINSEDWETLWCVWIIREMIWQDGLGPLQHYRHNMQLLVNLFSLKEGLSPIILNLRTNLLKYHHLLASVDSTHLLFSCTFPHSNSRYRLAIQLGRCLVRWPFFSIPALFHIPVYFGSYIGSGLQPTESESTDQNHIVLGLFSGLFFVPIYVYLLTRSLLAQQSEINWISRLVAASLSLTVVVLIHIIHDGLVDTNFEAWKRLRLCWKLKENGLNQLWDARKCCEEGWKELREELKNSNDTLLNNLIEGHEIMHELIEVDEEEVGLETKKNE